MTVLLQLLLIPVSIGGLLAVMAVVHRLARHYGWSAELQRKCVHVTTGLYGSTEAEPIAHLRLSEINPDDWVAMRSGAGLLAGNSRPLFRKRRIMWRLRLPTAICI